MISQTIKAALAEAKARGTKLGQHPRRRSGRDRKHLIAPRGFQTYRRTVE
jgi:hypothetical protein